jgi:hypothetical protein
LRFFDGSYEIQKELPELGLNSSIRDVTQKIERCKQFMLKKKELLRHLLQDCTSLTFGKTKSRNQICQLHYIWLGTFNPIEVEDLKKQNGF